jgi:hypothetical protein
MRRSSDNDAASKSDRVEVLRRLADQAGVDEQKAGRGHWRRVGQLMMMMMMKKKKEEKREELDSERLWHGRLDGHKSGARVRAMWLG